MTGVARDERFESFDFQRAVTMAEDIAHQLSVNTADEFLIHVEQVVVVARGEVEPQSRLIDDGVQAGIIEVLVEHVDLSHRIGPERVRRFTRYRPQHSPPRDCSFDSSARHGARCDVADGVENDRRPAASAQGESLTADQPLVFEDPDMIAHSVEGDSAPYRQLACGVSWRLLDGTEQLEPTGLCQPAKVMGAAGHVARVDGGAGARLRFDRK